MSDLAQLLREASAEIPVGEAPVARVLARGRRRRRRRTGGILGGVLGGVAAAGLAVALGVVAGTGVEGDPRPTQLPVVSSEPNPAALAWWAAGELHLADRTVAVAEVAGLATVSSGVVYADESGQVVHVTEDGRARVIGDGVHAGQLAANPQTGWVAWVADSDRARPPVLRVYDTEQERLVASRELARRGPRWGELDEGDHPIAIDAGTVYYADQDGDYAWDPIGGGVSRVAEPGAPLLDAAGGALLRRAPDGAGRVEAPGGAWRVPAGTGQLSPGGRLVLTDRRDRPALLDVDGPIPTGLHAPGLILAHTFASDTVAVYVGGTAPSLGREDMIAPFPGGPYRIIECAIGEGSCTTVARADDLPVLAR